MSAEMMVAVVAVVAAMAFALGYAIGGSETQEDADPSETKKEVSANVSLILEAERARKEAAAGKIDTRGHGKAPCRVARSMRRNGRK